jgi:hypothetical protein
MTTVAFTSFRTAVGKLKIGRTLPVPAEYLQRDVVIAKLALTADV